MGGDRGPDLIARAAVGTLEAQPSDLDIVLVGARDQIEPVLRKSGANHPKIQIAHASEIVGMSEAPASAIRKKKDSSIAVAMRLLKAGEVDAFVSAGNTGAVVAGSLVSIGRLHGVSRPAIATFYPTSKRATIFLDIGANSVCTPKNLVQFGVMGSVFAEYHLGIKDPRVGLLNIGEERSKGTDMIRAAYDLLRGVDLNFIGNVEGRDVMAGKVDVVVCDGFVGNVVLKFSESILAFTSQMLRQEIKKSLRAKLGALLLKPVFSTFRQRLDYAEYGGAPLLGVNGVVIICHGKSSPRAVRNAILMAQRFVSYGINEHIEERFKGSVSGLAKVT